MQVDYRPQRNWGARIHEYVLKGMGAVILENELLRIGVLVGKGTDIFEFNYKPRDMDFVWLTSGGVRNPTAYLSSSPDAVATFIDYYLGGWQEIFPNGGVPSSSLGASFGQHGEVSALPWDYTIIEDTDQAVAVQFSVRTQKTPFVLTKVLRLEAGSARLHMRETLVNESDVDIPAMWGQHLAFGQPFLTEEARVHLPEGVQVIPHAAAIGVTGRRVDGSRTYTWPYAEGEGGDPVDLRLLPPPGAHSEMLYLTNFSEGWYAVENPRHQLRLDVSWDLEQMPYVWFWQEFGATRGYPWYGRHYNIGLEPFSSYPTNGLAEAVRNGTALTIGAKETRHFAWHVQVQETGKDSTNE